MKKPRIFSKTSITPEDKLNDLLQNTVKEGSCLVWTRALNTDGYPTMYGNVKVHRLVYELSSGEDISDKVIRHTCDNPKCINPDHLITGTHLDNIKDMVERDRYSRVITKDHVKRVKELSATRLLLQKEIAKLVDIDTRRVSDIINNRYTDEAKFIRR